jgi:hypothetical protein
MDKWFNTGLLKYVTEETAKIRKLQDLPIGAGGGICHITTDNNSVYCTSNCDKLHKDKDIDDSDACELFRWVSRQK